MSRLVSHERRRCNQRAKLLERSAWSEILRIVDPGDDGAFEQSRRQIEAGPDLTSSRLLVTRADDEDRKNRLLTLERQQLAQATAWRPTGQWAICVEDKQRPSAEVVARAK